MNKQTYKLTFLPLFEEDLLEVTDYISTVLQNPSAAHRLVGDIELAIIKRLEMPLSFPINPRRLEIILTTESMLECELPL